MWLLEILHNKSNPEWKYEACVSEMTGQNWVSDVSLTKANGCTLRQLRTLISPYMTTGKTIALTRRTFVGKVMSLIFHMLSKLVIAFLPRSKHLLTSWLQSPFAVILQPKKIKSVTVSIVSPSICYEVLGPEDIIFIFWKFSFKLAFSLFSFTFIKRV